MKSAIAPLAAVKPADLAQEIADVTKVADIAKNNTNGMSSGTEDRTQVIVALSLSRYYLEKYLACLRERKAETKTIEKQRAVPAVAINSKVASIADWQARKVKPLTN